jgi:hypothetical protein
MTGTRWSSSDTADEHDEDEEDYKIYRLIRQTRVYAHFCRPSKWNKMRYHSGHIHSYWWRSGGACAWFLSPHILTDRQTCLIMWMLMIHTLQHIKIIQLWGGWDNESERMKRNASVDQSVCQVNSTSELCHPCVSSFSSWHAFAQENNYTCVTYGPQVNAQAFMFMQKVSDIITITTIIIWVKKW